MKTDIYLSAARKVSVPPPAAELNEAVQKEHKEKQNRRSSKAKKAGDGSSVSLHKPLKGSENGSEDTLLIALEESRQRRMETSALLRCTREVLRHRDFDRAARSILNSCREVIGADSGFIALLPPDGPNSEMLFLDMTDRIPGPLSPGTMPVRGLFEEASRRGRAIYYNNFAESGWGKHLPAKHLTIENVIIIPLEIEGKGVGLLGLANKPKGFTEDDARMGSAFGELASVALYNSRMLELLENSEERFRSVVQSASDAVVSVDRHGNIIFWNNSAKTVFGYSSEEVIGKPLTTIVPESLRAAHSNGLKRVAQTGESDIIGKTHELTGLRRDGSEFPLELSVATWRTREGIFFTGIIREITYRKVAEENLRQSLEKIRRTLEGTIQAMALTVEMKDPYTSGHQNRVASLACAIGAEMGLSGEELDVIRLASLIHDIGKINVPAEILSKPGRLTDLEFSLIQSHTEAAYEILKNIEFPWPIATIVYQHHERMNGSGYPQGLKGESIVFEAKILSVADVVEAMASHRPYRPAPGIDKALKEIAENSGTLYDPAVVEACLRLFSERAFTFERSLTNVRD